MQFLTAPVSCLKKLFPDLSFHPGQIHTEEANEEHYKSRKDAIAKDLAHYEEQLASYKNDRQNTQEKANDTGNRLEAAKEQLLKADHTIQD